MHSGTWIDGDVVDFSHAACRQLPDRCVNVSAVGRPGGYRGESL